MKMIAILVVGIAASTAALAEEPHSGATEPRCWSDRIEEPSRTPARSESTARRFTECRHSPSAFKVWVLGFFGR
jgi:hypothetical protein